MIGTSTPYVTAPLLIAGACRLSGQDDHFY